MSRLIRRGLIWYAWVPRLGGGTRRISTNCTDKKAAEKRAAELEREAVDPAHAAANKATTQAACDEFVGSRERRGRAAGTIHHYTVKLGHLVRLLPARLADVDAAAVERFITTRLSEGAQQTTVKKEVRALGATLHHAKRLGLYVRDVDEVIPELDDTYKPRERALSPWELVTLASFFEPHRAAHLVFIVATGARWGESVRAQRSDLDLERWLVALRGTKTKAARRVVPIPPPYHNLIEWARRNAPGSRVLFEPWASVNRDLDTATELLSMCARHRSERLAWARHVKGATKPEEREDCEACAEAIPFAPVSPNDLRRTFSTWLRGWGVSPDLLAAALGHTTTRMVERVYGRLGTDELARLLTERTPAGLLMDRNPAEPPQSPPDPPTPDPRKPR